jgi:hypothetical protein
MISRRRFLEVGGGTAGAAAVSHRLLASVARNNPDNYSLPPALARLKSRKSEAVPISREERHERQEHARKLMSENTLDAIVLMEGTSLKYFTGIRWWGGERLFAMVLPAKGAAFYVCPAFEEGRAREQLGNSPEAESPDVRTWQEDESPYQRVAQGLKEHGLATGKVGIEETVRFVFADGVAKAAPQVTAHERDGSHRGLPQHQKRARDRAAASGLSGNAGRLRRGLSLVTRRLDTATGERFDCSSLRTTRFSRRSQRTGRRVHRASSRIGHAAGDPRRFHRHG